MKVLVGKTIVLVQVDAQTFSFNEEITLMNWGNAYAGGIDPDGKRITGLDLEFIQVATSRRRKSPGSRPGDQTYSSLTLYLSTISSRRTKLKKDEAVEDFFTPVTEFRKQAFVDCNIKDHPQGVIIQFELKGYFKLDVAVKGEESRMIFFDIFVW